MSKALGLKHNIVELAPHSPEWARAFEAERAILETLGGEHIFTIHHIGSTSHPGLSAKPIIDILVVLHHYASMETLHQIMEAAGYEYQESGSCEERTLFAKGASEKRTHHIHFTEAGSEEWYKAFLFWDYMRTHPEEVATYEALKKELAEKYPADRNQYSQGKAGFIKGIIEKAKEKVEKK